MKPLFIFLSALLLNTITYSQKKTITFLALGDSYTAATSELPQNGWPHQLTDYLNKKGLNVKEPVVIAGPGWTSKDLLENVGEANLDTNFDLVSLMIGVNNQYRKLDFEVFKKEFNMLLDQSISLAGEKASNVMVISIPDWSVTPFARFKDKTKISKELATYNDFIKEKSLSRGVHFINITPASRNMVVNKSLIASDSLHPSRKMYQTWSKKIGRQIQKSL